MKLVNAIVPFHISHNAEAEAVDLLIEVMFSFFRCLFLTSLNCFFLALRGAGKVTGAAFDHSN